jgi:RNA polymerase sigma-70 factor (ECF subfamily)
MRGSGVMDEGGPAGPPLAIRIDDAAKSLGSLDSDLIARARRGHTDAFGDLLRPILIQGCRLAHSLLGDWEESENVVQEAAVKAWRAFPRLPEASHDLRPWFLAIVANQARSVRRQRAFGTMTVGSAGSRQPGVASTDGTDDDLLDLRRAVAALNETQRTLLFSHYCLELPLEEAAQVAGFSPAAAKSELYRSLRAIRLALGVSRSTR